MKSSVMAQILFYMGHVDLDLQKKNPIKVFWAEGFRQTVGKPENIMPRQTLSQRHTSLKLLFQNEDATNNSARQGAVNRI